MTTEVNALPVLVVDDDEPTQRLLQTVLRRFGYSSEVASNGREAITQLQTNRYAAVVLDMMMPSVGGGDVIAFLSGAPDKTPVIVCSAAGPSALAGFDPAVVKAIVRKPFDVDQFIAILASVAR